MMQSRVNVRIEGSHTEDGKNNTYLRSAYVSEQAVSKRRSGEVKSRALIDLLNAE